MEEVPFKKHHHEEKRKSEHPGRIAHRHVLISKVNPALTPNWIQFSWQALRDGHFVTGDDSTGAQLGQMTPERWAMMYKQLSDLKLIDKPFDPATAYTLQFVAQE